MDISGVFSQLFIANIFLLFYYQFWNTWNMSDFINVFLVYM